jgi:hypothetical protein
MQLGPAFRWNGQQKQELGTADGPVTPQNLNRFAYVTNNPLRYADPTGHELDEVGTVTLTLEELEVLVIDLNNIQFVMKLLGAMLGLAGILAAILAPLLGFAVAALGVLYIIDGEQISGLANYFQNALLVAQSQGLQSIDITVSEVSNEGFWYDNSVAITTSVSNSVFFLSLFTPSGSIFRNAAGNW